MIMILAGVALVAAVSTAGDYVWFEYGVEHRVLVGILHGAVLLASVGGVIGAAAGRTAAGIPAGAAAGIGGALVYYAIASVASRNLAMIEAWAAVWLILAVFDGRVLRAPARRSWAEVLMRGVAAAALGGVAFYLMMDTLWGRPPAGGRNYLIQFGAWLVAWTPGILAITAGRMFRS
jgi:hypothetical protein